MEITTIHTLLEQRGILLTVGQDGKLLATPAANIPPELAQIIKDNRATLLAKLKEEQRQAAAPVAPEEQRQAAAPVAPEEQRQAAPAAPAPETEHQGDTLRPWRPTPTELARWQNYYQAAPWYVENTHHDNPTGLALEYVTDRNAPVCCALFSAQLLTFYANCTEKTLTTESGPQELDPCQFTEALRNAYEKQRGAALLALAFNFLASETRRGELTNVLAQLGFTFGICKQAAPVAPEEQRPPAPAAPAPVTEQATPVATTRQARAIVYADIAAGRAVTEQAATLSFTPGAALSDVVGAITAQTACNRLFLCGEMGDFETWLLDTGMYREYQMGKRGHYLSSEKAVDHVARYEHRATGQELEVRTLSSWYGDAVYTPEEAQGAMHLLNLYLQREFVPDTRAYATPALTYQSLWLLLNRVQKKQFALLPENIRATIHASSGQGRVELCTVDDLARIDGLHYYDGVFMYSALCWGMPTELATHDHLNVYAGKVPARYRLRYTLPTTWAHIGLFMTPKEQATGKAGDNRAWCYPGQDYRGRSFETWADGAEVDVLIDHYAPAPAIAPGASKEDIRAAKEQARKAGQALAFADWRIEIQERIVFKEEKDSTVKKPLDVITERLARMREKVERDMLTDTTRLALYKLVRGALRNILLHGIGSFHRTEREVTFILPVASAAPDGYSNMRLLDNGMVRYNVPHQTEKYTQQFEHPEWTALVWARCRGRITRAALALPRRELVAIRTDAIATTTEQPQWAENDKRGTLRPKWHIARSMKAPHTFDELDKLVHQYVKEDR